MAHRMPSGLANAESTNAKHAFLFGKIATDVRQVKLDLSAGFFDPSGKYHALRMFACTVVASNQVLYRGASSKTLGSSPT